MRNWFKPLMFGLAALMLSAGMAAAESQHHGDGHAARAGKAAGVGVLNAINVEGREVNVTHGPVPALGWPEMTMDLAVSRFVDLAAFETGQKVQFSVEKGRDSVFRITAMCATESVEVQEGLCAPRR